MPEVITLLLDLLVPLLVVFLAFFILLSAIKGCATIGSFCNRTIW